jgi:hypothetical protein
MYAAPEKEGPSAPARSGNGDSARRPSGQPEGNGRTATDFVSEDDVRRAIQKGEKIYINAKTIITPAARDIGEPAEIFAKT